MPRELLVLCVLGLAAGAVAAQPPRVGPTNRPPVSPYLNLLRPGNSPGVNYYNLVKPEFEFRNNIQALQQQVTTNQTAIADLNSAVLPTTGHSASFLNTGGYFSGGPGRAGGGGVRPGGGNRPGGQTANRQQPPRR